MIFDPELKTFASNARELEILEAVESTGSTRAAGRLLGLHNANVGRALKRVSERDKEP